MTHHGGEGCTTFATTEAGQDLLRAIVARLVEVAEALLTDAGYRAR